VLAFAFGEIGMAYGDFWGMLPREFWDACRGHNEKVQRDYRTEWERTRWAAAVQANSSGFSKKSVQPRDLLKFPWEKEEVDRSEEIKLIEERRKWRTGQSRT